MHIPFSEGPGLGLNHSQVPQRQVPAMVGLLVAVHFNGHRPLGQKFHELLGHLHRQLLHITETRREVPLLAFFCLLWREPTEPQGQTHFLAPPHPALRVLPWPCRRPPCTEGLWRWRTSWRTPPLEGWSPAPPGPRSDTCRRQSWTGGEEDRWPGGFSPEVEDILRYYHTTTEGASLPPVILRSHWLQH